MKKYLLTIFAFILISLSAVSVFAQTPSATSSAAPTEEENQKQIERIKDIVASRVAELKLVEKRGILGTVESTTNTQITVVDGKKSKRIIDIDEITEFNDPNNEDFGISDAKKGNMLGVIGLLNKETNHILARYVVIIDTVPVRIEGVIKNVDRRSFVVTVVDEKGKEQKIDIDTSTKVNVFDDADNLVKSGFSKIQNGERVFASGFIDPKDETLLNAGRFIHFVSVPPSRDMARNLKSPASTSTPTVVR